VEFSVDLADAGGSKIDTVTERVENAPAKTSVPFQFPIRDGNAAAALIHPGSIRVVD
jgi:hypothetical protein